MHFDDSHPNHFQSNDSGQIPVPAKRVAAPPRPPAQTARTKGSQTKGRWRAKLHGVKSWRIDPVGAMGAVIATGATSAVIYFAAHHQAWAVPSFSDQTGDACSACHVGSFGPQLTPHGRAFKLSGYADGSKERTLPMLSGMTVSSFTHTAKGQDGGAAPGFHQNDNLAVDQASVFIAGRIFDRVGMFSQITWDGVGHHVAWDNTDVRYGREFEVGGVNVVAGASVNNNPTVSDPYNTTPAWGFPYAHSGLAPKPAASALIEGGLAGRVVGASAYGLFGDLVYLEAGAYSRLGAGPLDTLGVKAAEGPVLDGAAPYWRAALQQDGLKNSFMVGTFGLAANVYPGGDRSAGTNRFVDIGVDASYQWRPDKKNVFSLYGAAIFEDQTLNASQALGTAEKSSGHLNTYRANASYYYDQTYGLTVGAFKTAGSSDAEMYAASPVAGAAGKPNSTGYMIQADWTPFGKEDSWGGPWANLRLGVQYTGYTEFNGAHSNYDGFGRNASDNNTLWLFAWTAF